MTTAQTFDKNLYRTTDLSLTAALCVLGFIAKEMEHLNAHRAVFIFENTRELSDTVERYWQREIKVEPQDFFNQLKILKARIYQH